MQVLRRHAHLLVHLLNQIQQIFGGCRRQAVSTNARLRTGEKLLRLRGARGNLRRGCRTGLRTRAHRAGTLLAALTQLQKLAGVLFLAGENIRNIGNLLTQRLRVNAVLTVVRLLNLAAAVRLINRHAHRIRNLIGVHVHLTGHVTRRTTNGLNQRRGRTQEAFLIGIQNRNQGHLGQVQSLTQQVNTDQHIKSAQAQLTQKLHTT